MLYRFYLKNIKKLDSLSMLERLYSKWPGLTKMEIDSSFKNREYKTTKELTSFILEEALLWAHLKNKLDIRSFWVIWRKNKILDKKD